MTELAITRLYNKLFSWEGKKANSAYPIHKKLDTENFGYHDIYEWICKTFPINSTSKVLDAGCGVGYGSMFIAKQFNCNVTGISLSNEEIDKAKSFSKLAKLDQYLDFKFQSYDDLTENSYDFIIAIESVKHTLNLKNTLTKFKKALTPNGRIIIIDDFLIKNNVPQQLKTYKTDWMLVDLLKKKDFVPEFKLVKDLTPFVITKNNIVLYLYSILLTFIKPFYKIATIVRGGIYLEKLFNMGYMKYYVIEYKKYEQ